MASFHIRGGEPLQGTVAASGSKNAALPIMAATLLTDEPVTLYRVPRLGDVATMARLLDALGMHVTGEQSHRGPLRVEAGDLGRRTAPWPLVRRMRASFCVLGPLLARRRSAVVPLPGGCRIGPRPVDLHLKGLTALGADLRLVRGRVFAKARRLQGTRIDLSGPFGSTVTGTANVMMAAVLARGTTTIRGAAREPEIVELGQFLNRLGARIEGLDTSCINIDGVDELGGASYAVTADRIEVGTLLAAAIITAGRVTICDAVANHLSRLLDVLDDMGAQLSTSGDSISIMAPARPRPIRVAAQPYPGIPTDLQSQLTAVAVIARGRSLIRDGVFPQRFHHVTELNRMGASIRRHVAMALVRGESKLKGQVVRATDLRASAALVLAGLAAEGKTTVRGIHHLDRGYERLEAKLRQLGARIQRHSKMAGLASAVVSPDLALATAPRSD